MYRCTDGLHLTPNIELLHVLTKVGYGWMCGVIRTEDPDGLSDLVRFVDIVH